MLKIARALRYSSVFLINACISVICDTIIQLLSGAKTGSRPELTIKMPLFAKTF